MKKFCVLFLSLLFVITSCKKEDTGGNNADPKANTIKVFKNTSGNPSANALQAQIVNTQYKFTINYYGSFDSNNDPELVHAISYKKNNNDTTAFITIDPITQKVESIFTEVNGVRQPIVFKHEYIPGNDNTVRFSIYNYNWSNNTATLKFQSLMSTNAQKPLYLSNKPMGTFRDIIGGVLTGIVVVEAGIYVVAQAAAITAAVVAAGPAILLTAAATAAIILASDLLLNNANASDFDPYAGPLPPNTPVNNPAYGQNNPTPNLPPSPCSNINIHFLAGQDSQGNVLVFDAGGSTGPYTYAVGNLNFQSSQVITGLPAGTSHFVFVKDANGCIAGRLINFNIPHPYGTVVAGGNGSGIGLNQFGAVPSNQNREIIIRNNNIYALDADNKRLLKWPFGATSATVLQTYTTANFSSIIQGFYVDAANNIYISYFDRIEKNGVKIASIKEPLYNQDVSKLFYYPRVDNNGNLYVYAAVDRTIYKWSAGASTPVVISGWPYGNNLDTLNGVTDMELDGNNNLYVADVGPCGNTSCSGGRIIKYTPGIVSGTVVLNYNPVSGFDVDNNGNLFLTYSGNDVRKFTPGSTTGVVVAGGNGVGGGLDQLNYVEDVKLDPSGKIYIWDYYNYRIMRW